nr:hypothetical protein [Tanacetum cinerariifolium]
MKGISTASDEFPLPEDFPIASEERFPLPRKRDATAEEVCNANKDKEFRKSSYCNIMYRTPCPVKGVLRMQQYLQNEHYALWEVIEFGDSYEAPKDDATTDSTNDHQLRFSKYKIAQELWAAILKTFGGNEATRKTKKNLLKQQYGNFKAKGKETLKQTFNRLQAIVSHLESWTSDLDTMSLDDPYNHLRVYEPEVQKKSDYQNMAFISTAKNNSGNGKVNTASIPIASTQFPLLIKYEDINQIDEDDIEEMDSKWNMALLSMRADTYWKKTGKKISIQGTDVAGFDKSKVECFNCHKMGHFARECRAPRSQDRGRRENFKQGSKVEEQAPKALMAIDGVG